MESSISVGSDVNIIHPTTYAQKANLFFGDFNLSQISTSLSFDIDEEQAYLLTYNVQVLSHDRSRLMVKLILTIF